MIGGLAVTDWPKLSPNNAPMAIFIQGMITGYDVNRKKEMKPKSSIYALIIALFLASASTAVSQNQVSIIRQLDVDIWPDYDRPLVLVLLSGRLPDKTKLPVTVTLPLPQSAQLNAVARIDSRDGRMKDDITVSTDPPGMVTFTTPDLRFRVEYYFPYTVKANRHVFNYTWLAPVGINVTG